MSSDRSKSVISVERLAPGLFIDLGLPWTQHPFLFRRFMIGSWEDVAVIQDLTDRVIYYPDKSRIAPPDAGARKEASDGQSDKLWQQKKERVEQARAYRNERKRLRERFRETTRRVAAFHKNLNTAPANAVHDADEIIQDMVASFEAESSIMINLVNLSDSEPGQYTHALNVTVLSLSLAKAEGYDGDAMRTIAQGALLHDIGKNSVPARVLHKKTPLTVSEQKLLESHPLLGLKQVDQITRISRTAAGIISGHHELLDGSGYPNGLTGDAIARETQLVAIANLYDNLCNPNDGSSGLAPKNAMAKLYSEYSGRLEPEIVQQFIKSMGVYPPGTLVQLTDGSTGVVVEVDSGDLLHPRVLLYSPDIPRNEALEVSLAERDDLEIHDVLRPQDCPNTIRQYLGLSNQLGYFFREGS